MSKNKMEDVAKLLNLELNEEFKIKGLSLRYRFTNIGLQYYSETERGWLTSNKLLPMLLQGEISIIKIEQPILDEKEKEYLSSVIKPFRDRISYIVKCNELYGEYIEIDLRCYSDETDERTMLPKKKKGTMYKSMVTNKRYTLYELGL